MKDYCAGIVAVIVVCLGIAAIALVCVYQTPILNEVNLYIINPFKQKGFF
jgi:hypothetical protein